MFGRDDGFGPEMSVNECVVGLAVVAGVGQKFIEGLGVEGLDNRLFEFDVVGQGADVGDGRKVKIIFRVADDGQFGIVAFLKPAAPGIVDRGVSALVTGGINCCPP